MPPSMAAPCAAQLISSLSSPFVAGVGPFSVAGLACAFKVCDGKVSLSSEQRVRFPGDSKTAGFGGPIVRSAHQATSLMLELGKANARPWRTAQRADHRRSRRPPPKQMASPKTKAVNPNAKFVGAWYSRPQYHTLILLKRLLPGR